MAEVRKKQNQQFSKRNTRNHYLVGRRIKCDHCKMSATGTTRTQGDKKRPYYRCNSKRGVIAAGDCDLPYFRADYVDAIVWEWIKELVCNPEKLLAGLDDYQAEQETENDHLRQRLVVIDDLLADNQKQLERLIDLYITGDFDKSMLVNRKKQLEDTILSLEQERSGLVATLEAQTLTDEQKQTIFDLSAQVRKRLPYGDKNFAARRELVDMLNVQVYLMVRDSDRWARLECILGQRVSIVSRTKSG